MSVVPAVVLRVHASGSDKTRCLWYATFGIEGRPPADVCVRHRFRTDLNEISLTRADSVNLAVKTTFLGSSVVGIERR